jgi:hypothetical protein
LPDVDVDGHSADLLREWKGMAEAAAYLELRGMRVVPDLRATLRELEANMPDLIAEMRQDIEGNPFCREFVLHSRTWSINVDPNNAVFGYTFQDHPHLRQKIRVLENHGLVTDISYGNLDRFIMSEEFADYLLCRE